MQQGGVKMQRIFILTSILCLITTSIALARVPNVLCYVEYTYIEDEYAHSLAAMQSLGAMNITTLSHFQNLDLSNIDIFFIPDQDRADTNTLQTIGTTWSTALTDFLNAGGVIVSTNVAPTQNFPILNATGLIHTTGCYWTNNSILYTTSASHPLSEGLFDTYMGANVTSSIDNDFSPNGTVIVKDPYERPIVVDIPIGNGHIVLIGHDYYASSPNQDLILANAVWRLLPEGMALPTAPTKIQYEPVLSPIMHYDPWWARPLSLDKTGGVIKVMISLPFFVEPVDIYVAIGFVASGSEDEYIYVLDSNRELHQFIDMSSITPWRVNQQEALRDTLLIIPLALLPSGNYTGYLLVVPANTDPHTLDLDTSPYYLWFSTTSIP